MKTWNERLAFRRAELGLSQADFARRVGVKPPTVYEWETGITKHLKGANLVRACDVLGVTTSWLLSGRGAKSVGESAPALPAMSRDALAIPLMSSFASMGLGFPVQEHETVIDNLRLSQEWCRRNLSASNLGNLAALSAYGDSMRPTFDDGDILIVDRGVNALTVDAVYVLQFREELYVKRIQRRPDGKVTIRSDNALYEPIEIDPASDGLRVLGRVVWAWNGRKL